MTTSVRVPPAAPPSAAPPPVTRGGRLPWVATLASGLAVLLAAGPMSAIVQGSGWFGHAATVVTVVVAAGLLLHRLGPIVVAAGQAAAVLVLLTVQFADHGLLGVLPGPAAFGEFGGLLSGAGQQIDTGTAPVPATPEILFLVTAAFGLLAIGVHLAAVSAAAPAAAGVPLLAVFAVPAALTDVLLPWWAMAAAAAGFGLLLVAETGIRRRIPGGIALVAVAVVLAVGVGAAASFVGTAGRFDNGSGSGGSGGSIGLSPFTALRGQLEQTTPTELFRVKGLTRPTYLRALTLRQYVPDAGWQATRPEPGVGLPGPIQAQPGIAGDLADVEIENVAFRDYWLPLYGEPLDVGGLPEGPWLYDKSSDTGYTGRPRQENGWREQAFLPAPTVTQLRQSEGSAGVGPEYLDVTGVDPRVGEIAKQVVAGRNNNFDRAMALQDYFTGPNSQFTYSLQTAPGAGDDALVEFLTVGRAGYCEQFASAMAVMLRTVGVPARVAVGFTAGIDDGQYRSISTSDAHAWVEAWFPGVGWTIFDPTPLTDGRTIAPPYVQEAQGDNPGAGKAPAEQDLLPGQEAGQEPLPAPAEPEQLPPPPVAPSATEGGGLPLWPIAVVLLVAVAALVPAGLRALARRRRMAAVGAGGPGAAGAGWAEVLAESADRGVTYPPSDTVRGAARRLVREHKLDGDAQQALRQVVGAVESSWYGDVHPAPGELQEPVRAVRAGIASESALSLRGRLLPRSVVHRTPSEQLARAAAREPADHRS
ncbi:transglutaminaseTgpA domain-containing protein [Pseudonocardia sp.]|uniref:transglutaminase TgpA family protein n=1 Tax=Pseudonocardia sp. TaxID=60912 RepID=UPI002D874216|nr:transglutaminaseTgpA domain-containing protein [Pseudonocardia sp.]